MKTVTLSSRFYYSELNEQDAIAIRKDIVLYNRMLHKAYKTLSLKNKGLCIKNSEIHKDLKKEFGTMIIFHFHVSGKLSIFSKRILNIISSI